jgi:flagellar protein FliS
MTPKGYAHYKTANVETTDQGKLILIVYDWAIRHCRLAIEKFDIVEERANLLTKVQDAVTELICGLDMEKGRDIAKNLYSLYNYMNRRLIESNIKKDKKLTEEVLGYLTSLRDAWGEAVAKVRQEKNTIPVSMETNSFKVMG